ncbi:hypothetical protein [Microbacterium sp.]|uniref:hypothetical protein n=1 Tax=Microbacterium sp. TaxID=51671 RepID=UPI0028B0197B|nr:hypothetical protein [Microbacterium sp.]
MAIIASSCTPSPEEPEITPSIAPQITPSKSPPTGTSRIPRSTEAAARFAACVPDTYISSDGVRRRITAFSGLAIVGVHHAYALKADNAAAVEPGWATFSHVSDLNTPSAVIRNYTVRLKNSAAPYPLGHANGLEYHRTPGVNALEVGSFYIPMMKPTGADQVAQMNGRGEITKLFKARQGRLNKRIASITYRGGGEWIVASAGESILHPDDPNVILRVFYTASIVGDYFELEHKFFVPTTRTFNTAQDIAYDAVNDELLVPVWDGLNSVGTATGRRNRIIVVSLGAVVDNKLYRPVRWINYTPSEDGVKLFEFEGIDLDSEGRLFLGSNVIRTDEAPCTDAIHEFLED